MSPPSALHAQPDSDPGDLHRLEFNLAGLQRLRKYLGDGDVYRRFQDRFDAADLAWFVAGAHKDGQHEVNRNAFHHSWFTGRLVQSNDPAETYRLRRGFRERVQDLVWDAVSSCVCLSWVESLLFAGDNVGPYHGRRQHGHP